MFQFVNVNVLTDVVNVGDLVLLALLLPLLLPPELLRHPLTLALRLVKLDRASSKLLRN